MTQLQKPTGVFDRNKYPEPDGNVFSKSKTCPFNPKNHLRRKEDSHLLKMRAWNITVITIALFLLFFFTVSMFFEPYTILVSKDGKAVKVIPG